MLEKKERKELISLIVAQYTRLAGTTDQMFQVISPRVIYTAALWRQEGPFKGSGSCRDIDKYNSEMGVEGIAKDTLISFREKRNQEVPGISTVSDCPYHRSEGGCTLKELKSPRCLSHMEAAWELWKFGIDGYRLSVDISQWSSQVLSSESLADAYANGTFVGRKIIYIAELTEEIKKFPHIGLPVRPKVKRSFAKPIA